MSNKGVVVWDLPDILKLWPCPEGAEDKVLVRIGGIELPITGAFKREHFEGPSVLVFTTGNEFIFVKGYAEVPDANPSKELR